jgi:hypothetical protein
MYVIPGLTAFAVARFVAKLNALSVRGVRLTTVELFALQLNGPTDAVISVPWLKA